jgi:hypothetical protein
MLAREVKEMFMTWLITLITMVVLLVIVTGIALHSMRSDQPPSVGHATHPRPADRSEDPKAA